tara:strand:- start:351 stop:1217 length:867 start_codon:yes stop_codon:yes gene_type:complete
VNPWILASRPKTLPAAISPVILGLALAYHNNQLNILVGSLTLLASILIQIGTNLANDAYDFLSGADNENRMGPKRATNSGLLNPKVVLDKMRLVFLLSIIIGCYLAYIGGWPIVLIGLLAILSGIAYTGGPYPLGYNGLGDIFVFVFFGLIAVPGTYYLQTNTVSYESVLVGILCGSFSTAILVVNNVRDLNTDKKSNKKTIAVILGKKFCEFEYFLMLLLGLSIPVYLNIFLNFKNSMLLVLVTIPIAIKLILELHFEAGKKLNSVLERTARLYMIITIILSFAIVS